MTTPSGSSICHGCSHLREATSLEDRGATCDAFPEGIPEAILQGGFDHREPFPGDGGVRFEQEPGMEWALAIYEAWKETA